MQKVYYEENGLVQLRLREEKEENRSHWEKQSYKKDIDRRKIYTEHEKETIKCIAFTRKQ